MLVKDWLISIVVDHDFDACENHAFILFKRAQTEMGCDKLAFIIGMFDFLIDECSSPFDRFLKTEFTASRFFEEDDNIFVDNEKAFSKFERKWSARVKRKDHRVGWNFDFASRKYTSLYHFYFMYRGELEVSRMNEFQLKLHCCKQIYRSLMHKHKKYENIDGVYTEVGYYDNLKDVHIKGTLNKWLDMKFADKAKGLSGGTLRGERLWIGSYSCSSKGIEFDLYTSANDKKVKLNWSQVKSCVLTLYDKDHAETVTCSEIVKIVEMPNENGQLMLAV